MPSATGAGVDALMDPPVEDVIETNAGRASAITDPIVEPAELEVFCNVCGCLMESTGADDIFVHPENTPCVAVLVNAEGDSIDRQYFIAEDGNIYESARPVEEPPVPADEVVTETDEPADSMESLPILPEAPPPPPKKRRSKPKVLPAGSVTTDDGTLMIPIGRDPTITVLDVGLLSVFDKHGVPRLGGASGDLGWSSFSIYQRCPYLFKRLYIDGMRDAAGRPPIYIEVGSAFHAFAAVYYQQLIEPDYPITPQILYDELLEAGCDAQALLEAWRLWAGYALFYEQDFIIPLAVEYHVVDKNTRESARYDLIAKIEEASSRFVVGTYIVETKTASRFDEGTLNGWVNDGEIIGQMMLWNRLKLNKKFGKLVGVMMNIIGKQKVQQFHRTCVPPQRWQINQHAKDLRLWHGLRQFVVASGTFPHARANCIDRYGKCSQWDHCAYREG